MARREQGYTIIELLLAVGVMGLLAMAVAAGFEGQKKFYVSNERTMEAQEDARLVLDLLKYDARMAGFMVAPVGAIASGDGGVNAPDRLCVSTTTAFDTSTAGEETTLETMESAISRFHMENTNVVSIPSALSVVLSSLDIDGSADGIPNQIDFVENGGIIISDGGLSHCAAIDTGGVDAGTNTITLDPAHAMPAPAGFDPGNVRAFPAVIYDIPNGSTNLMRDGLLMSSAIEDLQVEFWDSNTALNNPVHDLNSAVNGANPANVQRVRISVVSRSTVGDVGGTKKFGGGQRPAVANRTAGAEDRVQRRIFTANVRPRNISLVP